MSNHFKNIKSSSLPHSEAEITGSILESFISECRKDAIKELNKKINLPGFRPGHVPETTLIKAVGETGVLEEAAEIALAKLFNDIIKESKVSAIGRPTVTITKLAPSIDIEFKIITAVEPVFDLPDYKKIAKAAVSENSKPIEPATEKEIQEVEEEIKRQNITPNLPEGESLTERIKENIVKEKEFRAKEVTRIAIIDALIKGTNIEVPEILVQAELEKMLGQFKDDVARTGLKWEDYMKSIKKSESDIKAEWKDKALDRAKAELIVMKISEKEKIEPDEKEVEHEANHLLEHYPDADPIRARIYIYTQMRNEKVFEYLESLK